MNTKQKYLSFFLAMMLLLLGVASISLAEQSIQTLHVSNEPIKGQILLEKTGLVENATYVGEPNYEPVFLKDAVFEIIAAEDIIGKDGKQWYKAGDVVSTMKTSGEGRDMSPLLPLGKYTIKEISAPSGYVLDPNAYTVELRATDHKTPVVTAIVSSINDPAEILLQKTDVTGKCLAGARFGLFTTDGQEVAAAISDDEGMVRFMLVPHGRYTIRETHAPEGYLLNRDSISVSVTQNWTNPDQPIATVTDQYKQVKFIKVDTKGTPMAGITFQLINAETNTIVEKVVSDENGVFTFTMFDYGAWIVREVAAPEGYCRMQDYRFVVDDHWTEPSPIMLVNIPDHYAFKKTDSSGEPLAGVKFVLEDTGGRKLQEAVSDRNGMVRFANLSPGTYYIRETETLSGYTLSGDARKMVIDDKYVIPEKLPVWINYTTIQTGVNLAVTGVMWIGIGLMIVSGTIGLVQKRRSKKEN